MQSAALADLGKVVRKAREARGWSRATLAREAGVAAGTISNLELYGTEPRWDTVRALAETLDLDLAAPDEAAT